MRFRDRIKGRPQSKNVEVVTRKQGQALIKKSEMTKNVLSNPRALSPEPIETNKEKSNKDRALGTLGQHVGGTPGHALKRRAATKDPKPGKFDKDAQFFKHTIKGK